MKAIVLYKPESEFSRAVEEFVHDFKRRASYSCELVDVDTPQGTELAKLYDIVQYPSVLAVRDDGQLVRSWAGTPLPVINDVVGFLAS